jgi:hypothetical protein
MPTYRNLSKSIKTFYGVTFLPNDVKSVPGYINDTDFMRINEPPVQRKSSVKGVVTTDQKPISKPVVPEVKTPVICEPKIVKQHETADPIPVEQISEPIDQPVPETSTSSQTIGVEEKKRPTRQYKKRTTTKKED